MKKVDSSNKSRAQIDTPARINPKLEKPDQIRTESANPADPNKQIFQTNQQTAMATAVKIKQERNTSALEDTYENVNQNSIQAPMANQQNLVQNNVEVNSQRNGAAEKGPLGVPNLNETLDEDAAPGDFISGDLDESSDDPEDLNCKLCNKWFTYTAPDKGKSNFWFKISPLDGEHLKVS